MCLFIRLLLQAGHCLFLETLISAIRGVPGAIVTPGPLLLLLSPTGPAALGRRLGSVRARSRPPWHSLPASSPLAEPGPGVGWVGPRPLGSWSLLCSGPAPPGEGRREGSGGRAGEASGGPGPGSGPSPSPGHLPAFPPGLGLRAPGGARNWSCLAPRGLEHRAPPSAGPGLVAHLGLGEEQRALELGPCSALRSAPFAAEP